MTNTGDIAELIQRHRVAVFCGAGISFNSGLPVVGQIMNLMLRELGARDDEQRALLEPSMPFELFMQTLQEQSDAGSLLDMFDGGEPNTNHFFLARLVQEGLVNTVCTTNFDTLLERAMTASGMVEGHDYSLFYSDADLGRIDWASKRSKLIKIHGSIVNRAEMAVTLRQVAARVLTAAREQIVDQLFLKGGHDTTLILGYSCSDQFDVSPRIESYNQSPKSVLLVEHDHVRIADEPIGAKNERNPFRKFVGRRLFLKTDDLVRDLWGLLLKEPYRFANSQGSGTWKEQLCAWANNNRRGELHRSDTVSALLFAAGRPKLGLARLQSASASRTGNLEDLNRLLNEGAASGEAGQFDSAIRALKDALRIALSFNHPLIIARVLANMAMAYKQKGLDATALRISLEAERNATVANDLRSVGICQDTISSCYREMGNIQEAIRYGKLALKNFEDSGEVKYLAVVLGNLALCRERLGDSDGALTLHEKAYATSHSVGDLANWQIHCSNIMRLARELNRPDLLSRYQAVSMSSESDHGRAVDLANTANHLSLSGRLMEALPLYEDAIQLMRVCGDDYGLALHSCNRGLTLQKLERFTDAVRDFEKSANTYGCIGKTDKQADALVMHAQALEQMGLLPESFASMKAALALMQSTNYEGQYEIKAVAEVVRRMREDLGKVVET